MLLFQFIKPRMCKLCESDPGLRNLEMTVSICFYGSPILPHCIIHNYPKKDILKQTSGSQCEVGVIENFQKIEYYQHSCSEDHLSSQ